MQTPRFILVGDQGRMFSAHDALTNADFAYASVGMFLIIRTDDFHFYGRDRRWKPIPNRPLLSPSDFQVESFERGESGGSAFPEIASALSTSRNPS
ncbi:MAG: hypothetical protein JWM32_3135 [Verrucomicrobia bacterium]|nr:hypothetical protein [Verrucomicrobiota bacterium]